jgi:hypothetical protein
MLASASEWKEEAIFGRRLRLIKDSEKSETSYGKGDGG